MNFPRSYLSTTMIFRFQDDAHLTHDSIWVCVSMLTRVDEDL